MPLIVKERRLHPGKGGGVLGYQSSIEVGCVQGEETLDLIS